MFGLPNGRIIINCGDGEGSERNVKAGANTVFSFLSLSFLDSSGFQERGQERMAAIDI